MGFFVIIIITFLLKKAVSQHAASMESKQADPAAPRQHLAAEPFANSAEFTSAGSPRKRRRGLGHKGSNNCRCFPLSKDKSGTVLLEYLLLRGITSILGGSGGILALYLSSVMDDTCFLTLL